MSSAYPLYRRSMVAPSCQRCGRLLAPNRVYCEYCGYSNVPLRLERTVQKSSFTITAKSEAIVPVVLETKRRSQALEVQRSVRPQFPAQVYVQSVLPRAPQAEQYSTDATVPQSGPLVRSIPALSSEMPVSPMKIARRSDLAALRVQPGWVGKKREIRRWQIVCLILLVLLLLVTGVGGYFYSLSYISRMSQGATPARRTMTTMMDMQNQNRPSLPMQNKVVPPPAAKPLFADTFRNNARGWKLGSQAGQFLAKISNGMLLLENDNNMMLKEFLPGKTIFSNFRLAVDAKLSKGDPVNGYGIYFRVTANVRGDLLTYYRFELYGDGTFAFFKGVLVNANNKKGKKVQDSKLFGFTANPAIARQGKLNHVVIIAQGPMLTFVVNGKTLLTISDGSHRSGSMVLFISNRGNAQPGAQVAFSNLVINPV
jgi:3-keto-disaccharide hydrolase